jgi:hypothetical protein
MREGVTDALIILQHARESNRENITIKAGLVGSFFDDKPNVSHPIHIQIKSDNTSYSSFRAVWHNEWARSWGL